MKIALCLSGLVRNYHECKESHIYFFIEKLNADVFIHTWSKVGSSQLPHWYNDGYTLEKHRESIKNQQDTNGQQIVEVYSPKNIEIEYPDIDYFYQNFNYQTSTNEKYYYFFNTIMMHYSIKKSNNLRKTYEKIHNFKYDIVIRCRFDLFFEKADLSFKNLKDCIENDTIYLPPNENTDNIFNENMKIMLENIGPSYMPNDQFAYSNAEAMDYYCSVFDIFQKDPDRYTKHPEEVLSQHLWKKNTSKYKNIKIDTSIKMNLQSRKWK